MAQSENTITNIAAAFNAARQSRRALSDFPGMVPDHRADAYAIQSSQMDMRGETVAGWKVAMTAPAFLADFGEDRLAGPVFASRHFTCTANGLVLWAVIPGGFAAVEAEFIAVMAQDVPEFGRLPTLEDVAPLIGSWHAGLELAGSPLATINDAGPFAVVADCGNNDGAVIGPAIADWRDDRIGELAVQVFVDGILSGTGSAAKIRGGPLAAVAFLIAHLEQRGRPLKANQFVSTGALTGIHKVKPGQGVQVQFGTGIQMNVAVR